MSSAILEGLNPEQLEAVTLPLHLPEGAPLSALVLAGAGSGKTRVLTTRIAWLIQSGALSPFGLLAVTFTNKAAKEMLSRIAAMLPPLAAAGGGANPRGMWVGTFHGLCHRLLRAHHRDAGLPQLFQILDAQDQLSAVKRLLKAQGVDEERFPPREVQSFINARKEAGLRARAVEPWDGHTRRLAELYAVYERQCEADGVVDFAELLLRCYELLADSAALREHYRGRFRHILVDEFQDTNPLQYRWLRLLAGPASPVFAVGDDDQSIYKFRGACSANMQEFQRDFPGCRLIKLEQNYRSHGNILDAANALIGHNRARLGKNLWTDAGRGEPLRFYQAATDLDEAQFIVEEAQALRDGGVALADVAVLYRANAQSRVIEHALFSAGLPYRVYGGLRFFERQEVKHALAYLRLAANPDDDNALLRVINFPARGIGARTVEGLQEEAQAAGGSLWQAARRKAGLRSEDSAVSAEWLAAAAGRKGVEGFVALIESLRAATVGLPLPELVEHVVEHSGLIAHYRGEKEGADRIENLGELTNAAAAFVMEAEDDGLAAFLAHAALEAGEHQAAGGMDAVQLMTVHSAKGLEFHSVFVSGLEEGLFPHENSMLDDGGLEEERRLMYVALTRARRRLYLSLAQCRMLHGQTRYNIASRFLREIPPELLRPLGPMYGSGFRVPAFESRPGRGKPVVSNPERGTRNAERATSWRVGQSVSHPKFGAGVIVSCEGHGSDARVQVRFARGSLKWLALEYAKLSAV